jgi:hypothetical protein
LLAFESELIPTIGEYCVSYMKRTKAAPEGRPAGSVYELHGIGCRHPQDLNLFLDMTYSELYAGTIAGLAVHSDSSTRAKKFFASIEFTGAELAAVRNEPGYVGIELRKTAGAAYAEVVGVARNMEAERQGLRIGDRVVQIEGVDMEGRDLEDTVKRLRGDAGSRVGIVVLRPDSNELQRFFLLRRPIR